MPKYKVKAQVLIDIETDFEMAENDFDPPTADMLKQCIDDDINNEEDIAGAIGDCKVINFISTKEG